MGKTFIRSGSCVVKELWGSAENIYLGQVLHFTQMDENYYTVDLDSGAIQYLHMDKKTFFEYFEIFEGASYPMVYGEDKDKKTSEDALIAKFIYKVVEKLTDMETKEKFLIAAIQVFKETRNQRRG